jgi:hypothetical protein
MTLEQFYCQAGTIVPTEQFYCEAGTIVSSAQNNFIVKQ